MRTQLLLLIGLPLLFLLVVETVVSYLIGLHAANVVFDRWLLDSVHSIAQEVRFRDGKLRFVAGRDALEIFGWDEVDEIYFQISTPQAGLIAGTSLLPLRTDLAELRTGPVFEDLRIAGKIVRAVSIAKYPGTPDEVIVSVAETLNKRRGTAAELLIEIVFSKGVMLAVALLAVGLALDQGLRPLAALTREIGQRSPQDLTPLAIGNVPVELRGLVENTNELLVRIEHAISAREQFIGNIAHQTRTPLAGIKLQAELALRDNDPERVRHSLAQIAHAADHMAHVNSQLLKLARAEVAHGRGPRRAKADLATIVHACCAELGPRALARGIEIGLDVTAQTVGILGETTLLHEMVRNLIDNAIVYGRAGGHIWVRLSERDGGIELMVEDDGPGIPQQHWSRIYDRFFRPPDSPGEGCGLGLPIVREIAQAHGAEIRLEERAQGGTRFVVTWPKPLPPVAV